MGKKFFQLEVSFSLGNDVLVSQKLGLYLLSYVSLVLIDWNIMMQTFSLISELHYLCTYFCLTFHCNNVGEGIWGFFWVIFNLKCLVPLLKEAVMHWTLYCVCPIKVQTLKKVSAIPFTLKPLPSCLFCKKNPKNMYCKSFQEFLKITVVSSVSLTRKTNSWHRLTCTIGCTNHKQLWLSQRIFAKQVYRVIQTVIHPTAKKSEIFWHRATFSL